MHASIRCAIAVVRRSGPEVLVRCPGVRGRPLSAYLVIGVCERHLRDIRSRPFAMRLLPEAAPRAVLDGCEALYVSSNSRRNANVSSRFFLKPSVPGVGVSGREGAGWLSRCGRR